jgi:hypothetical protein
VRLYNRLQGSLESMWPARSQQELLLDLGERKRWGKPEKGRALKDLEGWLSEQLLLRPIGALEGRKVDRSSLRDPRLVGPEPSVNAKWAEHLAPACGATPKTLQNSLSPGWNPKRSDHRWLLMILRCMDPLPQPPSILFTERSPASISQGLARAASGPQDAADATLLLSLVALWQRRRPTERVRANRGAKTSRRSAAKPAAELATSLIQAGQLKHLAGLHELAGHRALMHTAVEAALTSAHLHPHPARSSDQALDGEVLLRAVEATLSSPCFSHLDSLMLQFRIAAMRAWRDRGDPPALPAALQDHPYLRATLAIRTRQSAPGLAPDAPGVVMLLPQLHSRGLLGEG